MFYGVAEGQGHKGSSPVVYNAVVVEIEGMGHCLARAGYPCDGRSYVPTPGGTLYTTAEERDAVVAKIDQRVAASRNAYHAAAPAREAARQARSNAAHERQLRAECAHVNAELDVIYGCSDDE